MSEQIGCQDGFQGNWTVTLMDNGGNGAAAVDYLNSCSVFELQEEITLKLYPECVRAVCPVQRRCEETPSDTGRAALTDSYSYIFFKAD